MATNCPKCEIACESTQKIFKCALCQKQFHSSCAGINVKTFDILSKLKSVCWFCDACDGVNLIEELREFRDFRSQHAKLSQEMNLQSNRIQMLEEKMNESPSNLQAQQSSQNLTRTDVAAIFRDQAEIEKRKNNLCIFGLPVSNGGDDKHSFVRICKDQLGIQAEDLSDNITEVLRVGRDSEHENANYAPTRPRPVIVKLASFSLKSQILKNAVKLKNYRPENSNLKVFISNDLTREQQIESKKLRAELARRRGLGESVTIRRGNIVQVESYHSLSPSHSLPINQSQPSVDESHEAGSRLSGSRNLRPRQ